jgi:hypothetical protein
LLQAGLTLVSSAVVRYQQQFQPTNKAKPKFLSSTLKTLLSSSSVRDVINIPPAAIPIRWAQAMRLYSLEIG